MLTAATGSSFFKTMTHKSCRIEAMAGCFHYGSCHDSRSRLLLLNMLVVTVEAIGEGLDSHISDDWGHLHFSRRMWAVDFSCRR